MFVSPVPKPTALSALSMAIPAPAVRQGTGSRTRTGPSVVQCATSQIAQCAVAATHFAQAAKLLTFLTLLLGYVFLALVPFVSSALLDLTSVRSVTSAMEFPLLIRV